MHAIVFQQDPNAPDRNNWRARFHVGSNITFTDPQPRNSAAHAKRAVEAHVRGVIGKERMFDLVRFTWKKRPDGTIRGTWDDELRAAAKRKAR